MLCGLAAVVQASVLDGLSFDPFSFKQDGLASAEVDVGGGEVGDALVVSKMIIVGDELADPGFEVARQIVVLQQHPVLQRLVPALDLALGLGMQRGAAQIKALNPSAIRRDCRSRTTNCGKSKRVVGIVEVNRGMPRACVRLASSGAFRGRSRRPATTLSQPKRISLGCSRL